MEFPNFWNDVNLRTSPQCPKEFSLSFTTQLNITSTKLRSTDNPNNNSYSVQIICTTTRSIKVRKLEAQGKYIRKKTKKTDSTYDSKILHDNYTELSLSGYEALELSFWHPHPHTRQQYFQLYSTFFTFNYRQIKVIK